MKNNKELLTSLVKTTRTGQIGIRAILKKDLEPELHLALQEQLHAYEALEQKASALARERSWELPSRETPLQKMIRHMTWVRLRKKNRTTRIADMLIQGNTQGMICSLRDYNGYCGKDQPVRELCRNLIDCEIENIRQMQPFL